MALLLKHRPLVLTATHGGEPTITQGLVQAINFARAGGGDANFIVESIHSDDEKDRVKEIITALIQSLQTRASELEAEFEDIPTDGRFGAYLKVTVRAW